MNRLTEAGRAAMRRLLLEELQRCEWNLTHVAERLRLPNASAVLREIRRLTLLVEYTTAKAEGRVRRGGHRTRTA